MASLEKRVLSQDLEENKKETRETFAALEKRLDRMEEKKFEHRKEKKETYAHMCRDAFSAGSKASTATSSTSGGRDRMGTEAFGN